MKLEVAVQEAWLHGYDAAVESLRLIGSELPSGEAQNFVTELANTLMAMKP